MLSSEKIDWTGKYVFDENGNVDPHASHANGVPMVQMDCRPMPTVQDAEKADLMETKRQLESAMRPPTQGEFATLITRLGFHCGMQNKHPQAIRMMIDDYWHDFGHYPNSLIELACAKWRKKPEGNDWMPGSNDFLQLMHTELYFLKKLLSRTKRLLGEEPEEEEGKSKRTGMTTLENLLRRAKQ